jgi:hypothetical protein
MLTISASQSQVDKMGMGYNVFLDKGQFRKTTEEEMAVEDNLPGSSSINKGLLVFNHVKKQLATKRGKWVG